MSIIEIQTKILKQINYELEKMHYQGCEERAKFYSISILNLTEAYKN